MSQRISFVLSEIAKNKAVNQTPVISGTPRVSSKPPSLSEHHVISVEAPTLPRKRIGACIGCAVCIWVLATISLSVAVATSGHLWGVDAVGSQILLRRVQPDLSETRSCHLTLYVTKGKTSHQQLAVSLGLVLDGLKDEDDMLVEEKENGAFEAVVQSCTESLFEALSAESIQNQWRSRLASIKPASFVVVSSSHVVGSPYLLHTDTTSTGGEQEGTASISGPSSKATSHKELGKTRGVVQRGRGRTSVDT